MIMTLNQNAFKINGLVACLILLCTVSLVTWRRRELPTPIDAALERGANVHLSQTEKCRPNERVLIYPLYGAKGPNFDFISNDNGDSHVACYRAKLGGRVMGRDSKPIPGPVFGKINLVKKKRTSTTYCVFLDTGGIDLTPYFRQIDEETAKRLGATLE